jgi:flagellar motor switch protein FliM
LTKVMKETAISFVVKVGSARITVQDMLKLKVGDAIRLDSSPHNEISVSIEGLIKMKGRPGISSKKKALQITKIFAKEE